MDFGNGFGDWNTIPMRLRSSTRLAFGSYISVPSSSTEPSMRAALMRSFMRLGTAERRLATARRADECRDTVFRDVHRDVLEGVVVAVPHVEVLDRELRVAVELVVPPLVADLLLALTGRRLSARRCGFAVRSPFVCVSVLGSVLMRSLIVEFPPKYVRAVIRPRRTSESTDQQDKRRRPPHLWRPRHPGRDNGPHLRR